MHSFDNFSLVNANKLRYFPILTDAKKIVGAYTKAKSEINLGQVPLFLADGDISDKVLENTITKLNLDKFVIIHRPFDINIKKQYEDLTAKNKKRGYIQINDSIRESLEQDLIRFETEDNENRAFITNMYSIYFEYVAAKQQYDNIITSIIPVDAITRKQIDCDINEYLFQYAVTVYPNGIESILGTNRKISAIVKPECFMDGYNNNPPPL